MRLAVFCPTAATVNKEGWKGVEAGDDEHNRKAILCIGADTEQAFPI